LGSLGEAEDIVHGPWLPKPLIDAPATGLDPVQRVELDESVSMAL
jgi:hypothetical protein